jgi:hypothetical protein
MQMRLDENASRNAFVVDTALASSFVDTDFPHSNFETPFAAPLPQWAVGLCYLKISVLMHLALDSLVQRSR